MCFSREIPLLAWVGIVRLVRIGITLADAAVSGRGCTAESVGGMFGSTSMGDDELCIPQALQLKR